MKTKTKPLKVEYRGFVLTNWGEASNHRWLCDRYLSRSRYDFPHWGTLSEAMAEIDYHLPHIPTRRVR